MNRLTNNRFFKVGLTVFLIFVSCVIFWTLFSSFNIISVIDIILSILMPFMVGFAIAYIVHPIMTFFENKVFKLWLKKKNKENKYPRLIRVLSVSLSMIIVLGIVVALFFLIMPQLLQSIKVLVEKAPLYISNIYSFLDEFFKGNTAMVEYLDSAQTQIKSIITSWTTTVPEQLPVLFNMVANSVYGFFDFLKNSILGIIISFYVLYNKEMFVAQSKKILISLFPKKISKKIILVISEAHVVFGGFITGIILDSLIIGILCFIGVSLMQMPYVVLISVIIGVTNIIPFFGPFIGTVPAAFIILMENPSQVIWFVLFIIILQQFDGNILKPKILGNTTGLSTFWVLFAILIGGGLFGFVGLVLGVPAFSIIYTLVSNTINKKLVLKNLPTKTLDYYHSQNIFKKLKK